MSMFNCNCLDKVVEFDKNGHTCTINDGIFIEVRKAILGKICFYCKIIYNTIEYKGERQSKNRQEIASKPIPFFYCPICGTKTKIETPTEGFFYKLIAKE